MDGRLNPKDRPQQKRELTLGFSLPGGQVAFSSRPQGAEGEDERQEVRCLGVHPCGFCEEVHKVRPPDGDGESDEHERSRDPESYAGLLLGVVFLFLECTVSTYLLMLYFLFF